MAELRRVLRPAGLILVSFYSRRDGGGTPDHAWHRVSELVRLIEPVADPFHIDVVGHYVQIGAQRWDSPRTRRRRTRPPTGQARRTSLAGRVGRRARHLVGRG